MNGLLAASIAMCFNADLTLFIPGSGIIDPPFLPRVNSATGTEMNDASFVVHLNKETQVTESYHTILLKFVCLLYAKALTTWTANRFMFWV